MADAYTPTNASSRPGRPGQAPFAPIETTARELGLETRPGKNLCHYTSQEGLIGILKRKFMYATDATYLNDSQEIVYAVNLAKRYFKERWSSSHDRAAQDMLNVLEQTETIVGNLPVYVASFSEEPDLLSQWRGYCSKGVGFALCISPARIIRLAHERNWTLVKCIYDEDQQIEFFRKLEVFANTNAGKENQQPPREIVFGLGLLTLGTALKHPKFKEEAEWRATRYIEPTETPSIRAGSSTLVPYIDFPLATQAGMIELASIVVGPTPHASLSKRAVETLLNGTNTICPRVISSEIPFRNW